MKILPVLIAMTALGVSTQAVAQTAPPAGISCVANAAIDPTQVGHTGTDTLTAAPVAVGTDVGHTGTDTLTAAPVADGTDVGHTGTDTVTATAPAVMPTTVGLKLASDAMSGPGTMTITASAAADPAATTEATATCTVTMTSSSADCTVPDSVQFTWSSTTGGSADATVSCKRVRAAQTVTVSSGDASASFTLKK
ncbi:hypothetical protein BH11PSE14_BH11PSE14_12160 [soil metagenome]